jgi:hypothetical protein
MRQHACRQQTQSKCSHSGPVRGSSPSPCRSLKRVAEVGVNKRQKSARLSHLSHSCSRQACPEAPMCSRMCKVYVREAREPLRLGVRTVRTVLMIHGPAAPQRRGTGHRARRPAQDHARCEGRSAAQQNRHACVHACIGHGGQPATADAPTARTLRVRSRGGAGLRPTARSSVRGRNNEVRLQEPPRARVDQEWRRRALVPPRRL